MVVGLTVCEPLALLLPVHPPLAVHVGVVPLTFQVSAEDVPWVMVVGEALNDMEGGVGPPGLPPRALFSSALS